MPPRARKGSFEQGLGIENHEGKVLTRPSGLFTLSVPLLRHRALGRWFGISASSGLFSGGVFEVKSTNGDTMLGGEDFDEVLLKVRQESCARKSRSDSVSRVFVALAGRQRCRLPRRQRASLENFV